MPFSFYYDVTVFQICAEPEVFLRLLKEQPYLVALDNARHAFIVIVNNHVFIFGLIEAIAVHKPRMHHGSHVCSSDPSKLWILMQQGFKLRDSSVESCWLRQSSTVICRILHLGNSSYTDALTTVDFLPASSNILPTRLVVVVLPLVPWLQRIYPGTAWMPFKLPIISTPAFLPSTRKSRLDYPGLSTTISKTSMLRNEPEIVFNSLPIQI